jgi:hypothetical protein
LAKLKWTGSYTLQGTLESEEIVMTASSIAFRVAVCLGIIGMCAGIAMAISHNHAAMPAHAHLNVLGWVSLFLMGLFYRQYPALDRSKAARIQVGTFAVGGITLATGVALIYSGYPEADPVAAIGSLITLAGMLFFAFLIFRPERSPAAYGAPAE